MEEVLIEKECEVFIQEYQNNQRVNELKERLQMKYTNKGKYAQLVAERIIVRFKTIFIFK